MIVAHLGPGSAQEGGPAGYLRQLERVVAGDRAETHRVLFPPSVASHGSAAPNGPASRMLTLLRRARRMWLGAPRQFRAARADLLRAGGVANDQLKAAWAGVQAAGAPSVRQASAARADVWFAHDVPTAEAALAQRPAGAEVWLLLHTPMPLALYLVWCWGVPEEAWETVWTYPDVRAWTARERQVLEAVDRLVVPTPEAASELVRVDPEMDGAVGRVTPLMTGAAGRPRRFDCDPPATGRARWGLPADRPVVLFIGHAQPYRGLDLLVEALPLLHDAAPGVVAVAGCPRDLLPFHSRLRALGPVREVADLLAVVDGVINVNRFSLFDLSTIEACEAERLLILSPIGGNISFQRLGAGCCMLSSLDPHEIAAGIARVFGMDPAERADMGRRSRACYDAHLTPGHLRQRHLALYSKAEASRPVGQP